MKNELRSMTYKDDSMHEEESISRVPEIKEIYLVPIVEKNRTRRKKNRVRPYGL